MAVERRGVVISRRSGLRVALVYFAVAALWIVVSDWVWLAIFSEDLATGAAAQTLKGLFFVTISAFLIGWLAHREVLTVQRMKAELDRKDASLAGIFEAHPLPLYIYDMETLRFLRANDSAARFYGYSHDEFLKMGIDEIRPQDDLARLRESLENREEYQKSGVWRHRRADGSIVWVEVYSHAMLYGASEARLVAVVDVTEQKTSRARLVRALEAAAHADQAKGNLLSTVSHELRSPLHAILGLSQLVLEEAGGTSFEEDIRLLKDEAGALAGRVDRLIEAARMDTGMEDKVETTEYDLRGACEEIASLYTSLCEAKGLRFEFSYPEGVTREVEGSHVAVRKVLLNLLSNAVKFTESGYIRLNVRNADEEGIVEISVEDSGIGIPEGERDRIFDAFTQVDSGLSRKYPGSGLGLFLAAGLARRMHAELALDASSTEKGSRFVLRLPVSTNAPEPVPE